jgi:phage tail sheath gpL-like
MVQRSFPFAEKIAPASEMANHDVGHAVDIVAELSRCMDPAEILTVLSLAIGLTVSLDTGKPARETELDTLWPILRKGIESITVTDDDRVKVGPQEVAKVQHP